jgi:hypothetical protein
MRKLHGIRPGHDFFGLFWDVSRVAMAMQPAIGEVFPGNGV